MVIMAGDNYMTYLSGDIKIKIEVDGEEKVLSVGQANNLSSHANADVRKRSFEALEEAWE